MANQSQESVFEAFFANPTESMLRTMSAGEFQQCVTQVFARAGYETKAHLIDLISSVRLELYVLEGERRQVGAVSVHHSDIERPITAREVRTLQRNSGIRNRGVAGYVVTSGTADRTAHEQARSGQKLFLLTGEQFCRYARYVRASRFPEGTGLSVVIPPDHFCEEPLQANVLRAKILAFANNKGGVGKTTSARQFALRIAERGLQVLLVDMDPQHNLTEGLINERQAESSSESLESANLAHYFTGNLSLAALVRSTAIEGEPIPQMFLIPAHADLSLLDTGGAGRPSVEVGFARDLHSLVSMPYQVTGKPFDWVILDTPPAVSLFTRSALCAADFVVAPARSRPSSVNGTKNMVKTMDTMNALKSTPTKLLGCLLTHWQDDEHSTQTYPDLEVLFSERRSRILAKHIPFDVTIEKLHGATRHRATDAYVAATQEVLDHVQRT
jgi:cellulose biosynthesis protein BcsQ